MPTLVHVIVGLVVDRAAQVWSAQEMDSDSYVDLALQQSGAGDVAAAERSYKKAIRLNPAHGDAHNRLAQLRASLGDYSGAARSCSKVVRLSPSSGGAYSNLAYMQLLEGGRLAEARSNYNAALRLEPRNPHTYSGLAEIARSEGDLGSAEGHLLKALAIDRKLPLLHETLGNVLLAGGGREAEAERRYRAALRLDPALGASLLALGGLQHRRGSLRAAEESYRAAAGLVPDEAVQVDAHKWIGLLLAARGATQEATAMLRSAARLRRESGRLPVALVMNLGELGEEAFVAARRDEREEFGSACKRAASQGHRVAAQLPAALKAVRGLEGTGRWIAAYLLEASAILGLSDGHALRGDSAYGALWFPGFRRIAERALALAEPAPGTADRVAVVLGSALGEQCLFAVALGMRCVGHELLCNSTVQPARQLVEKHGLSSWVDLRCGDAGEAEGLGEAALVFVNDYAWEPDLRARVQRHIAQNLRPGAAVASFRSRNWVPAEDDQLPVVDMVDASASWGDFQAEVRVKPLIP